MHLESPWAATWTSPPTPTLSLCTSRGINAWSIARWSPRGSVSARVATSAFYLDLDGPWEVTDVDVKGDVWVAPEGELLTGEAVPVLLDVAFGHDGHLLPGNGSSCRDKEFTLSTLPSGRSDKWWMALDRQQHIIMNPLMGLSGKMSHQQLLLSLS